MWCNIWSWPVARCSSISMTNSWRSLTTSRRRTGPTVLSSCAEEPSLSFTPSTSERRMSPSRTPIDGSLRTRPSWRRRRGWHRRPSPSGERRRQLLGRPRRSRWASPCVRHHQRYRDLRPVGGHVRTAHTDDPRDCVRGGCWARRGSPRAKCHLSRRPRRTSQGSARRPTGWHARSTEARRARPVPSLRARHPALTEAPGNAPGLCATPASRPRPARSCRTPSRPGG